MCAYQTTIKTSTLDGKKTESLVITSFVGEVSVVVVSVVDPAKRDADPGAVALGTVLVLVAGCYAARFVLRVHALNFLVAAF